jgi:hypothetical protein
MTNEQDEVIVDDIEETNEEVVEDTEETTVKVEKPKRTPQEEYDYYKGRADRLAKKLGLKDKVESVKDTPTEKPNELDYGQLALLRTEGVKGSGELALFKEIMSETGKGVLDVLDSSYFKSRLTEFREIQESSNAIPKGKGRSGQTGANDIDMALAKYKESGELPTDFESRNKVIDLITKEEKGAMFSGPSVIK